MSEKEFVPHENGTFYTEGGSIISRISGKIIEEPSTLLDISTGTVLKHGETSNTAKWLEKARRAYRDSGFPENANAMHLITYNKYGTLSLDQICTMMNFLPNTLGAERVRELLQMEEEKLKSELTYLYTLGW